MTPRYVRPNGSSLSPQAIADLNALLDRVIVANFFWINLAGPNERWPNVG
jgi:hypothetical protein